MMSQYVLRGGVEGKKRLEILARAFAESTARVLNDAGLERGMTCLDLGCGGGDVTLELARVVGPEGRVVGLDADHVKLNLANQDARSRGLENVDFRAIDIDEWNEDSVYDLVYCRFVLTHVSDPAELVRRILRAVRPGGVVVVEDIEFQGHFCYPACGAFDEYMRLYRAVVTRRQGDAEIGPKLYSMLLNAGLQSPTIRLVQPIYFSGDCKLVPLLTLMSMRDAVLAEALATPEEYDPLIGELAAFTDDTRTTISYPRVFQVWGRRD